MNTSTDRFQSAEKIVTHAGRRYRIFTVPLTSLPAYLDQKRVDPKDYLYFPPAFDEVLTLKSREDEHSNP